MPAGHEFDTIRTMSTFALIDPTAPVSENVGAVLAYLDEATAETNRERREAEQMCERERRRIACGRPSIAVLHAVERGVAPSWVVGDLRRAVAA